MRVGIQRSRRLAIGDYGISRAERARVPSEMVAERAERAERGECSAGGARSGRRRLFLQAVAAVAFVSCQVSSEWVEPVTGMEFARVPAGGFTMGSPLSEPYREAQEIEHEVFLSEPFLIGITEVTQGQWRKVMGDNPSRYTECGEDCPVETVSYEDIRAFLTRLGQLSGSSFRLPTEAEWEYVCRAGDTAVFGIGSVISSEQANFDGRDPYPGAKPGPYLSAPSPVRTFAPNAWGVFDMNGNVWEWTEDEHCPYSEDSVTDPLGECGEGLRVIRGGSWYYGADSARCALRYTHAPMDDGPSLGFRLVWVP